MPSLLEVADLRSGYGAIEVVRGVSLQVPAGTVVAILGANGVGKTTLLRTIAGLLPASVGAVRFDGERIDGLAVEAVCRRGLVMVPEGRGVFPGLTVEENLRLAHRGLGTDPWPEFLDEMTTVFPQLGARRTQLAKSLSGGEQQMLAVCRAMAGSPRLVMFDELSMGLAPMVVSMLFDQVAAMRERGTTIVLVEQFLSHALRLADVCYTLAKGQVVWAGEPSELRDGAESYLG